MIDSQEYFDYLCFLVDHAYNPAKEENNSYLILLKELYRTEFYSLVPNDENREEDGKKLREDFIESYRGDYPNEILSGPCTVLEMLIGLSYRMNDILSGVHPENNSDVYFWEMITNLGLDIYTDEDFFKIPFHSTKLKETLTNFLERTYKRSGKGGIFPLKYPKKDQRKVELWYQMMSYIDENYPI